MTNSVLDRMAELKAQQEALNAELATLENEHRQSLTDWANEAHGLADAFDWADVNDAIGAVLAPRGFEIVYRGIDREDVAARLTAFLQEKGGACKMTHDVKQEQAKAWGCEAADIDRTLKARFYNVPRERGVSVEWALAAPELQAAAA